MQLEPPSDIEQTRGGFRQLYWNADEGRHRAPTRLVLALAILLSGLFVAGIVIALFDWVVELPASVLTVLVEVGVLAWLTLVVLLLVRIVDRRHLHDIGLGVDRRWMYDAAFGLVLGGLLAGSVVGVALVAGLATVEATFVTREGDLLGGFSLPVALALAVVFFCLVGVLEELLFRGYLLVNTAEGASGLLGNRTAVLFALAVSSALFGGVHALNPGASLLSTVTIFLFGILLGVSYVFTDRLAIAIGVHITWNFTLGSVFGLPVSGLSTASALAVVEFEGATLMTGGEFGPEGGLLVLSTLAVGTGVLILWLYRWDELAVKEEIATPELRDNRSLF